MTTTPANDSAAAVIAAHFERMTANSFNVYVEFDPLQMYGDVIERAFTDAWVSEAKEARTAFAAILDRLERVEAENARLREALTEIRDRDGSFWNLNLLADRALKAEDTQTKTPPTANG